jgi:hypothetical protein
VPHIVALFSHRPLGRGVVSTDSSNLRAPGATLAKTWARHLVSFLYIDRLSASILYAIKMPAPTRLLAQAAATLEPSLTAQQAPVPSKPRTLMTTFCWT